MHSKLTIVRIEFIVFLELAIPYIAYAQTPILSYTGHSGSVLCAALSPDGRLAATGGGNNDKTVQVWIADTGELVLKKSKPYAILDIHFSNDARTILISISKGTYAEGDAYAETIDIESGETLHQFESAYSIHSEFSPDGKSVVTAGLHRIDESQYFETLFKQWNADAGTLEAEYGSMLYQLVSNFTIAFDGKNLIADRVTYYPWRPIVSSVMQGINPWTIRYGFGVNGNQGVFSPDGQRLYVNNYLPEVEELPAAIHIIRTSDLAYLGGFATYNDFPQAISSDGKFLFSRNIDSPHINVWNVETGELIRTFENPHTFSIAKNAWRMISWDSYGGQSLKVWDISNLATSDIAESEWQEYQGMNR